MTARSRASGKRLLVKPSATVVEPPTSSSAIPRRTVQCQRECGKTAEMRDVALGEIAGKRNPPGRRDLSVSMYSCPPIVYGASTYRSPHAAPRGVEQVNPDVIGSIETLFNAACDFIPEPESHAHALCFKCPLPVPSFTSPVRC